MICHCVASLKYPQALMRKTPFHIRLWAVLCLFSSCIARIAEPRLIHSIAAGRDGLFLSHDSSFYFKTENCFIYDSLLLEELTVIPRGDSLLGLALKSMEI